MRMNRTSKRFVPFLTGLVYLAVSDCILALWPEPGGVMFYIRFAVIAVPLGFGLSCLWDAFFTSQAKLDRLLSERSENSN